MDVFNIITNYSSINNLSTINALNKEIYSITKSQIDTRFNNFKKYVNLINKIKTYFSPEKKKLIQKTGLNCVFIKFITERNLSYVDIINMQELHESQKEIDLDIKNFYIMDYIKINNEKIILNVGSIIRSLYNTNSIKVFFVNYAYNLNIYHKINYLDGTYNIILPKCLEGDFCSWQHVTRVYNIDDFEKYRLLNKNEIIIKK